MVQPEIMPQLVAHNELDLSLIHHFQHGGVQCIAAEITVEIGVHFEQLHRNPLAGQQRQGAGVVDVGMGQDHGVERGRVDREGRPVAQPQLLLALEQPGVDEHAVAVRGDENGFALYRSASRMPNADSSQLNVTREVVIDAPGWLWPELPRDVPYPLQSMTAKSVKNTYNA